jgi:NADP-dependent 3-hydroxy acid dehydrogenase YdfG
MHRIWFITGAPTGFGRALAEAVLKRGDSAVLSARRTAALESLSAEHERSALAVRLDLTHADARLRAPRASCAGGL